MYAYIFIFLIYLYFPQENKIKVAKLIEEEFDVKVDPTSIYDVQVMITS